MPLYEITAPDGNTYRIEGPEGATKEQVAAAVLAKNPRAGIAPKPEGGFTAAARAGFESLKGQAALTAGKMGLMDTDAAQRYQEEQELRAKRIFKPTEEGWTEAPLTKFKELLGGSIPYMAAPIAAAGAAATLPVSGTAAAVLGGGAAGLASLGQFTGSNLARQLEAQKEQGEAPSLERASGTAAAAAAVPQAALDVVSLRALPLIRNLFKSVGKDLTEAQAKQIAEQGFRQTVADYAKTGARTAGIEGLTEAGQQYFERLQAGLNISDAAAREEYIDSFIGGAVLGAGLAPAGRFFERGSEKARAQRKLEEVAQEQRKAEREAQAKAEAEEAEKRKQPEYLLDLQTRYEAAKTEDKRRKDEIKALEAQKDDPASLARAKELRAELKEFQRYDLSDVVKEYNKAGGKKFFDQFAEQQRVAAMSPEDYMLERLGVDLEKDIEKAKAPAAPASIEDLAQRGQMPQQENALQAYVNNQFALAEQQLGVSPADIGKKADPKFRDSVRNDYTQYLLADPAMAQQLVQEGVQLPGFSKQDSNAILGLVKLQLKGKLTEQLDTEAADLQRAIAKPEGLTMEEYQAQLQEMGYMQPRQEEVQYDTTGKRMREQMTAPIQEQRTLGLEEPAGVERTYVREQKLDAPTLVDMLRTAQQTAPDDNARNVLAGLENNVDTLVRNKDDAADVAEYIRRMSIAPDQRGVSIQPLQDILAKQEQAKLSETEAVTQLARRRLTEEEQGDLVGTSLGPRKDVGIVKGEAGEKIANIAQQAKIGTPIREATDELVRAVQTELPFTYGGGRRTAPTSVAFNNWRDFSDYLGSEGLQALRSVSEDVSRGAYPNIHRTGVLVNKMMAKAADIRAQVDEIQKARQAIIGKAPEEAEAARKLLQETSAALEKSLREFTPDPKLIEGIRTAREKLTAAQNLKATLLAQMQQNADTLEASIAAFEEGMRPVAVREKGQAPTVALGYEMANIKEREAAKQQAIDARDRLKKAIDELIAHQQKVEKAQRDVNFIGADTAAPVRAELTRRLNDVLQEEKRLRNTVAQTNERFMRFVSRSMKGATPPSLRESTFKNFLVEEAKLTDMINGQQRQINGLRLSLNNAMMRVNAANVAIENMPEVAATRQGLRQGLLQAEALDREMRADLTERLERPEVREREQAEKRLTGEAGALESKARAAQRAGERLAAERPTGAPKKEVTAEERLEADRKEREAKQRELEIKQGTAETVSREQITMETRRKLRQEITDKADKLDALLDIAEDPERTLDERVAATNEFQKLYDATYGKLARRDAKITSAMRQIEAIPEKIREIQAILAQESALSKRQQNKLKDDPEALAAAEKARRDSLNAQIAALMKKLEGRMRYASEYRGIDRVMVPTKAEKAEIERERQGEGEVMAPGAEQIARTQTQERQVGPVVKQGKVAPAQFRTGTEESRAGESRTTTQNKLVESRQRVEKKGPLSDAETVISDIADTRNRLKQIDAQLNYIQANPSTTAEGKAKQKKAKAERAKEKAELEQKLAGLLEQQKALTAEEEAVRAEMATRRAAKRGRKKAEVPETTEDKEPTAKQIMSVVESSEAPEAEERLGTVRVGGEDVLFSRGATANPSTTEGVRTELKKVIPDLGRVQIYDSVDALIATNPQYKGKIPANARGFVDTAGNKAFLIAGNIDKGRALSVLLHEVGAHIGLRETLGGPQYDALVKAVESWEKRKDGSTEARIAQTARARVEAADTPANQVNDELLAYAIEEAVNSGVKPFETKGVIGQWLSRIASLFQKALQKFGLAPKELTAQELVDMAMGAAKQEMAVSTPTVEKPADTGELFFSKAPKYDAKMSTAGSVADQLVAPQVGVFAKLKENLLGLGFRTQFLDALAPMEKIAGQVGDAVKAVQMMYYLRMYGQRMNFTSLALSEGVPQLVEKKRRDGGTERVIESVPGVNVKQIVELLGGKDVVKAAGSADAANRLFTLYMAKLRADNKGYDALNFGRAAAEAELKELERELASGRLSPDDTARVKRRQAHLEKTKDTLPTEADIKKAFAEIERNPTLKQAFAEARGMYNEYNQNLLKFMVQTGAMSQQEADRLLKERDYIPYYRVRGGVAQLMIGGETPVRIGNLKDSPHLQELMGGEEPIFNFLDSSVQNTSMLIDMAMRNIAVKNAMWEMGTLGYAKLRKAGKAGAPKGAVEFKQDGEDWYAVVDTDHIGIPSELLVKGLAGIPTMFPQAIQMMGIPARFLRRAVTATPVYAARQLFRDSLSSYIASGSDAPPVLGALKQIGKASEVNRRGVTGGQVFTGTTEDVARLLQEMQTGRSGWAKAFSKMEALSMETDAATRRAQYESYIKQGMSEMEATFMTLESMNFTRRGLSPSVQMITSMIPFMNAQIQSLDVLYRSLRGQMPMNERLQIREKLVARGMMLAGMSIMYALAMQDDETYKNARPDEKYNNWFVPIPGMDEKLRVPIPFELGYIFKALPEAVINGLYAERGADEAVDAAKTILRNLVPGGSNYGIPQAVKPLIEVGLGKSFFTGRDLESGVEQKQEPWARYRDNTSEAAKMLGSWFNVSPIKIETLVNGYTGSLGMALMQSLNVLAPTPETQKAERKLSELPVVGTVFQAKDATGIIDDTFDRMNQYSEVKDTYDALVKRGELTKADAYLRTNIDKMGLASVADSYRQQIGKITQAERQVRGSNLSPQDQRKLLDDLRQAKILVASSAREALGRIEAR